MGYRIAEYNEAISYLRFAHLDFFLTQTGDFIVAPFTKGEVQLAQEVVDAMNGAAEVALAKASLREIRALLAGEYSITRTDGKGIEMAEAIMIGDIFERADKVIGKED